MMHLAYCQIDFISMNGTDGFMEKHLEKNMYNCSMVAFVKYMVQHWIIELILFLLFQNIIISV